MATTQTDGWEQLFERISQYVTNGTYPPHAFCLTYDDRLIELMMAGDGLTTVAYVIIGAVLANKARTLSEGSLSLQWGYMFVGSVFIMCGIGHAIDVVNLFAGHYWIKAFWSVATGIVSVIVASMICMSLGGLYGGGKRVDNST